MIYVGIDNGLDGGIAVLNDGDLVLYATPTESDGKKRRVNPSALRAIIEDWGSQNIFVRYESPAGSKSVLAAVSMADSFARIETTLRLLDVRRESITAKRWQKQFWTVPKMAKGVKFDTKAAALKVAKQLWPNQDWRKNDRCKVAHDGLVDAALIAEYARRVGV